MHTRFLFLLRTGLRKYNWITRFMAAPVLCLITCTGFTQVYNIRNYGAVADSQTVNTKAIQAAIDKCSETGGEVLIPEGIFVSGTLYLKSNVTLHVAEGGVLKGSRHFADYPDNEVKYKNAFTHSAGGKPFSNKALLFAEAVTGITLTGKGTIDGSGDSPEFSLGNDNIPASRLRPCMLLIIDSKKITVQNLFLTNPAYWLQNYLGCDGLRLTGLKIYNQSNYNQDGMDIDARNVLVENCTIDTDDDGICFKSHDRNRPVENAIVRNCTIASNCNAIKFGTMSVGGLKNVTITHCVIHKASADRIRHWQQQLKFIDQPVTVISGLALEEVDGGVIENITVSDIRMSDVQTPVFIVLGNRGRPQVGDETQPVGRIHHILIKNITASTHSKMAGSITAYPGQYISDVQLENITIQTMGKGTSEEAGMPLQEAPKAYPENRMYGQVYPASGLYVRHVSGLTLSKVSLTVRSADYRPAVILDDVMDSNIKLLKMQAPAGGTPAIRLASCHRIVLIKPRLSPGNTKLLQLSGTTEQKSITVTGFVRSKGWISTANAQ